MLAHHPLGGGFLAVPGLKELFGEALEGLDVDSGVDGATHALHLEFLTEGEGEGFGHGKKVCQKSWAKATNCFKCPGIQCNMPGWLAAKNQRLLMVAPSFDPPDRRGLGPESP